MAHGVGKTKLPYKRVKRYDVEHYDVNRKKKEKTEFTNLKQARDFARQLFRQNRLISFANENGTKLTI